MKALQLPIAAQWMLTRLAQQKNRLALLGDLQEEYAVDIAHRDWLARQQWLFSQIVLPLISFLRTHYLWRRGMFSNYIKTAWRNLKRSPGYTAINIIGLAVGMAACMLIFIWVQDELSYDRFHENHQRIHRIVIHRDGEWSSAAPFSLARTVKKDFPDIVQATRFMRRTLFAKTGDRGFNENAGLVDPDFLTMLSFTLVKGDAETALATEDAVVITQTAALKYFGDVDPMGRVLRINGQRDATITGVIQDPPRNSSMRFDLLVNFKTVGQQMDFSWWTGCQSYVLLAPHTAVPDVIDKISGTVIKYDKRVETNDSRESLQPLARMHLYHLNETGPILYVYIFSAIAAIILLIACINFINLSTAQAGKRAREIGMRKTVGASRAGIIWQLYGETLLLSLIAFLFSLVMVALLLPGFGQMTGKTLTLMNAGRWQVVLGILGIALITGLISGSYPALLLSRYRPIQVLRDSASKGAKSPVLRRILVVFQFTAAIALIISSMVILRQLNYVQHKDLGFIRENIIRMDIPRALRPNLQTAKERLKQDASIVNVTSASTTPNRIRNINPFYWEGRGPEDYETLNYTTVDENYFQTFGLQFTEGRPFSAEFASDSDRQSPGYIINEAAVAHCGLKDPIGKMFSIWSAEGRVVGVVKDFHSRSLHDEIRPVVFLNTENWPHYWMFIRFQPEMQDEAVAHIQAVWQEMVPDLPCDLQYLDEIHRNAYANDARIGNIFRNFTYLAIFISCLGLLGLAAYLAELRTKEIGIRKALGASSVSIARLMSGEFLMLLGLSNLLAWPLAWWAMRRMLSSWAYRLPLAWWLFATAGLGAVMLALLTVSYQSLKAARSNPVEALKYE